ncbi:hypothetical protein DB35_23250 [Streptomyces abyssalis]|uniref:hypothetical protein n=1 Tax=Streptomyces abyssalis TaxID=933944 RepID=UPI00085C2BE8|nr:hypothetical protein [Streptomyces abyssalis]OEU86613.1 hypothetical protein DB35_23250 [Streptomyces abyssalis]
MRHRTGHDESDDQGGHRSSTVDRGAFSHARCTCGWLGPARRAREMSRADATAHSERHERDRGADVDGTDGTDGADIDGADPGGVRGSL